MSRSAFTLSQAGKWHVSSFRDVQRRCTQPAHRQGVVAHLDYSASVLSSSKQTLVQQIGLVGASSEAMLQAGNFSLLVGSCTGYTERRDQVREDQVTEPQSPVPSSS